MFKHYFEQMEGIASYPLFSLLVFVLFFLGVFAWVLLANKAHVAHMSRLPLGEDEPALSANPSTR